MNDFNRGIMGNNFNPTMNYPNFQTTGINTYPHYEIIQVKGRSGAEYFQMGPNSKILLLDSNDPIVWLVQTDGAGYKTIEPYSITPYQPEPQIDLNSIEKRLSALEEKINVKSNSGTNKQQRRNNNSNTESE